MLPLAHGRRRTPAVALAAAVLLTATVSPSAGAGPDDPAVTGRREAPGAPCAVCGRALGPGDHAWQIKGRWVPLHERECRKAFHQEPETYFATLQPRGALFAEEFGEPASPGWGWFALGAWVLLGLVCAAACGHLAYGRGASPGRWFVAGLLLNLPALAALLMMPGARNEMPPGLAKVPSTPRPSPCPACGTGNHPSASRCIECGGQLAASCEPETRRAITSP